MTLLKTVKKGIKQVTLLYCLFVIQIANSQQLDSILVSKNYQKTPIEDIIEDLKSTYTTHIYYKSEWLTDKTYTGSFSNVAIQTVLNKILAPTNILSLTIENNIYLLPRENVALIMKKMANINGQTNLIHEYTVIGNTNELGKYKTAKITGQIKDGATGDPLVGTKIIVENTNFYSTSGYTGNYVLELPAGIYKLKIISMGFEEKNINIKAIGPGTLNIEMFEESHSINEVIISSDKTNKNISRNQMSVLEMNAKTIRQLPSLIGEPDIIKSFATMPGVKTASEFGSGINVRGGSEDQNLFLLEGSPLYNTSHVMGLLSVINPDAVNSVSLYKGHIPVEYGQRVSSIMNIKTADPTIDGIKIKGGLGIYSSRLLIETPLFNELIKLKVGARSSYSDYLLSQMPDYNLQNSSASFYDITANAFINFKNNPVTLFGYISHDYFKYASDLSYQYGNKIFSLIWTHIFNPSLSMKATGAYSRYSLLNENMQNVFNGNAVQSAIESKSGKLTFEYLGFLNQELSAGIQGIAYNISPGELEPMANSQAEVFKSTNEQGYESSAFFSDNVTLTPNLSFELGFRYTIFSYLGPRTLYYYDENSAILPENKSDSTCFKYGESIIRYSGFEPRFSAKYLLNNKSSVKFSYNRNKQYISLLSHTSISTPDDVWKLADPYIKPIIADQMALGYYHNFFDNSFETSIEIYGKKLQNLSEYRNGAQLKFNNHVETEILNAKGINYGVELFVKKKNGKLNGSISYTFARAWKQTNGKWFSDMINKNDKYPSQYDIPHNVNANLNYKINRRVRFGATFNYSTGRPVTLPEYTYNLGYSNLVYYSDRNKYRLPDYHRLDFSLSIDESLKKKKTWKGSWTIAVLNVYGRKNAYSIFYQKDTPTKENNYQVFSLYKMYLIGIPMPTITYNFIF